MSWSDTIITDSDMLTTVIGDLRQTSRPSSSKRCRRSALEQSEPIEASRRSDAGTDKRTPMVIAIHLSPSILATRSGTVMDVGSMEDSLR